MSRNSFYSLILFFTITFGSCLIYQVDCEYDSRVGSKREALDISIGGGGYTPVPRIEYEDRPPPPPFPEASCPPALPLPPPPPLPKHVCPPTLPPPSPSPSPTTPPLPPPSSSSNVSKNIVRDKTIQEFSKKITFDPMGITRSWNREDKNVCRYDGFACDYRPDNGVLSVAAADFNGCNFGGPDLQIKDFLDKLEDLTIFHANSNNFTGIFPSEIGSENIKFLFELDLSNNKYTGGFPMSVLSATNLTFLDIRYNSFSGPVPGEVFNLDLDVLLLNNNQFTQQLPENIGSTPALYLTFANNRFTGPVPSSIGNAKNLREVLFLNNNFTGCLPYEIGFLKKATVFDASCNKLTGPIPQSFACLKKIEILNLANNEFYGSVPEMVCMLPNLKNLSISGNYFTQIGPKCRKLIRLKRLDVGKNCILDLPNQKRVEQCRQFFSKQRQCPNEKSLSIIPCSKSYRNTAAKFAQQSAVATPPISSGAISPQNKL